MKKEDIGKMIGFLKDRIKIEKQGGDDTFVVSFDNPTYEEVLSANINPTVIDAVLKSSWWEEMITDIIETPDFCDPEADEEEVLRYARDVVFEYIGKRIE
jgi:hypothetical protein